MINKQNQKQQIACTTVFLQTKPSTILGSKLQGEVIPAEKKHMCTPKRSCATNKNEHCNKQTRTLQQNKRITRTNENEHRHKQCYNKNLIGDQQTRLRWYKSCPTSINNKCRKLLKIPWGRDRRRERRRIRIEARTLITLKKHVKFRFALESRQLLNIQLKSYNQITLPAPDKKKLDKQ